MRFKATEIASLSVAALAFAGSIVSASYSYSNRNRELNIELVKIGIGILRADPKETQTNGARGWAIQLAEKYSGEKFSEQAKNELLLNKLVDVSTQPSTLLIPVPGADGSLACSFNPATGNYDLCHTIPKPK